MSVLDPKWITGFTDGEGCFHISIVKNAKSALGLCVIPEFTIVQHERDIQILYKIKKYFQCGVVRKNHGNRYCFRVRSLEHFNTKIIPFFEKYPLNTKKNIMFKKFRYVIILMGRKEHLTEDGIKKIMLIQNQMNQKHLLPKIESTL